MDRADRAPTMPTASAGAELGGNRRDPDLLSAADCRSYGFRQPDGGDRQVGRLLAERLTGAGHELAGKAIVRDDVEAIRAQVRAWAGDEAVDVIISTGGTGFSPRDVTPEAVKPLFRREMDGFSILFHQASYGTVGFSTLQSRAFAGQIDETFVFCLPGSTGACRDGWDLVLSTSSTAATAPARSPAKSRG